MSTARIITLENFYIDPSTLLIPSPQWPSLAGIKELLLDGYKIIRWSDQINEWHYIAFDNDELKLIKKKFPTSIVFTLSEIRQLLDHRIHAADLTLLLKMKRQTISVISEIKEGKIK